MGKFLKTITILSSIIILGNSCSNKSKLDKNIYDYLNANLPVFNNYKPISTNIIDTLKEFQLDSLNRIDPLNILDSAYIADSTIRITTDTILEYGLPNMPKKGTSMSLSDIKWITKAPSDSVTKMDRRVFEEYGGRLIPNLEVYFVYLGILNADSLTTLPAFKTMMYDKAKAFKYYNYLRSKKKYDVPNTFQSFSLTLGLEKKNFLGIAKSQDGNSGLYENLLNEGYNEKNLGSRLWFNTFLENPYRAKRIYNSLKKDGYGVFLGSQEDFVNGFAKVKPVGFKVIHKFRMIVKGNNLLYTKIFYTDNDYKILKME